MDDDKLLTTKEVAERYSIHPRNPMCAHAREISESLDVTRRTSRVVLRRNQLGLRGRFQNAHKIASMKTITYSPRLAKLPQFLTADEAAKRSGLTADRLRELAAAGYAPSYTLDGRGPLFRAQEIQDWVRDNLVQASRGMPMPTTAKVWIGTGVTAPSTPLCLRGLDGLQSSMLPPRVSGVYFLCQGDDVLYIGQSVDIHARVLEHRATKQFDRMFFWPTPASELDRVEGALIRILKPVLNGNPGPATDAETMESIGQCWRER